MIEKLLEDFEWDTIRQVRKLVVQKKQQRFLGIAHYLFQFTIAVLSLAIIMMSFALSSKYPAYRIVIFWSGSTFSFLLIVTSQFLKRSLRFLNLLTKCYDKLRTAREGKKHADLFYNERGCILLFLYLLLFTCLIYAFFNRTDWIRPGSELHASKLDSISQLISFSLTVLTIQTALFAFLLGQLLGKYSSKIAMVLIKHPVLILTLLYSFISIVLLWASTIYGFPRKAGNVIAPLFFLSMIGCLIFTIIILFKGIHPDRVVAYAGTSFSRRITRSFKPSTFQEGQKSYFWNFMRFLGLDWRSQDRLRINEPPPSSTRLLNEQLRSLFNTANKAVQDNHEELLRESLISILHVMQTYTKIRASYYGSGDLVYDYARNQMSALLKASSKSLNEYMIEEIVKAIGFIGGMSLEIRRSPVESASQSPFLPSHQLAMFWSGLLVEAFDLSHTLMNSRAANETISQLQNMALRAVDQNKYNTIRISFLSPVQSIHEKCCKAPGSYHHLLAADCLRTTINVWGFAEFKVASDDGYHSLYDSFVTSIEQMTAKQYTLDQLQTFNIGSNTPNIIALKCNHQNLILQDIFYLTLSRKFTEEWQPRATVIHLRNIIQLLKTLAVNCLAQKVIGCEQYITALYEISYLILRGLPESFNVSEEHTNSQILYSAKKPSNQEILEEELFEVWHDLFPLFYKDENFIGLQWEQNFFAILGLGIVVCKERKDDKLKKSLIGCINEFRRLLLADTSGRFRDNFWDYLQLVGAWTHHLLEEKILGEDIAKNVGELRPFSSGFSSINTDGRYGHLGYPTFLHYDFTLPALNSLRPQGYITDKDWAQLKAWNSTLMNDDILIGYSKIVRITRDPLEKQYYDQIRKRNTKEQ